jgi:hypothetical protein
MTSVRELESVHGRHRHRSNEAAPPALLLERGRHARGELNRSWSPCSAACTAIVLEGVGLLHAPPSRGSRLMELIVCGDAIRLAEGAVRPVVPMRVMHLSDASLADALLADRRVTAWLLAASARRLRRAYEREHYLKSAHVNSRLARLLLDLDDHLGERDLVAPVGRHGLTQAEIGQLVGATRETVNKVMRRFEARGLICIRRSGIILSDRTLLSSMAQDPHVTSHATARQMESIDYPVARRRDVHKVRA